VHAWIPGFPRKIEISGIPFPGIGDFSTHVCGRNESRIGRSMTMLVLRRKVEEAIVLDGSIRVVVLAVEGERVKIGIEAPDDVSIVREELLLRKQEEKTTTP